MNAAGKHQAQLENSGRRALLKAAALAGGAVAASAVLPGTWSKPVATIGGLPAHAQTSQACIPAAVEFDNATGFVVTAEYLTDGGPASLGVPAGRALTAQACLNSEIRFTAGSAFTVLWACDPSGPAGNTLPATSHTMVVATLDCGFVFRVVG